MEDAGYEVSTARDGLEALELVNTTAPALVLLDLEMPKLNGLEVTRFMRSRLQTRNVPVVMITSRAGDKYQAQAEEAGVTVMMGKPFSEDELILCVRTLMAQAQHPATVLNTDTTPTALETQ
jgi:CheY-like chemotaxis protein